MKRFITHPKYSKAFMRAIAIAFWVIVWQIASTVVGQEILMVSPAVACKTLCEMMLTQAFYRAVLGSFARIFLGFAIGAAMGIVLSVFAYTIRPIRILVSPMMTAIKATPVASFVILALIWISSKNLSVLMSFLMVLPIAYGNVLEGLDNTDPKLLEMARVFRINPINRARCIYIPSSFPFILTAMQLSLSMCWKAGIAAEVIGQPKNSIGSALQKAKVYFATPELFAWTLAIILISIAFERAMILLLDRVRMRMEGM